MPLDVRVELNPAVTVQLAAVRRTALAEAGKEILAISDALAPREPEPKHGEHLIETGYTQLEAEASGGDRVAVGYQAFWALFQHENPDYKHPHGGEWKFLEKALVRGNEAAFETVAKAMREAIDG
jgi:hypothetical protein